MTSSTTFNLLAVIAMLPAAILPWRSGPYSRPLFWLGWGLVVLGPGVNAAFLLAQSWHTNLAVALWVSVAVSGLLFGIISRMVPAAERLSPLLLPYLVLLALVAWIVPGEDRPVSRDAPPVWLDIHIVISVLTYCLLTLASVASLAVFLQERALKRKRPTALTRMLPSVVDADSLAGRLLLWSEIILGLGVLSGSAVQYFETGHLIYLGHKTLLSLLAFVMIGALLVGHRICGVRGRVAARIVLISYLMLSLAYPGVKFITQVLL